MFPVGWVSSLWPDARSKREPAWQKQGLPPVHPEKSFLRWPRYGRVVDITAKTAPAIGPTLSPAPRSILLCFCRNIYLVSMGVFLCVTVCRERSCRGLRKPHNKPSYLERRSRRGCHLRLTCHDEPYDLAFDYSAPGSRLPNEGLTDVLDHGSHGNDCEGRA